MQRHQLTRRQFIERTAAIAGGLALSPLAAQTIGKKTAVDIVPLGRTGLKISRLGIGCGTSSGRVQQQLGQDGFNRLVRYAYDQGITFIDIARSYQTHGMLREAINDYFRNALNEMTMLVIPMFAADPIMIGEGGNEIAAQVFTVDAPAFFQACSGRFG